MKYSLNTKFSQSVQEWFDNTTTEERKTSGERFLVGTTTDVLKSIGVKDYNIYFGASKINKIMTDNDSMTLDVIKQAVGLLEEPILVMESKTVEDSIVIFGEVYTKSNKPVMISVLLNPKNKNGEILDYGVITSAYGRRTSNLQNLINTSKIYYVNENKNRTDKWLKALGLQLPSALTKYGPINILSNSKENVKPKFSTKQNTDRKHNQLDIINKTNPAPNTYSTWIRTVDDIKTLSETLEDGDWDYDEFNPDLARADIEAAIQSGEITVYSSNPIKNGAFVSPSRMEAESYSGNGKVFEKTVDINDVAWIDPTQGQYAKVDGVHEQNSLPEVKFSKKHWHPNMSGADVRYVSRLAKNELFKTNNYLDNITKWLYNTKSGNTYFALYSTEDESNPTILYASKNKQAIANYAFFEYYINLLDEMDGESNDRRAETVDEIFSFYKSTYELHTVHSDVYGKSRDGKRDVSIHNGPPRSGISRALRNCLQDSYERRSSVDSISKLSTKSNNPIREEVSDYIGSSAHVQSVIKTIEKRYRLAGKKKLNEKSIERFANKILSQTNSKYSKEQLTERLTALFEFMANSRDFSWDDS